MLEPRRACCQTTPSLSVHRFSTFYSKRNLAGGDVEIGGRYADRTKLGYRWILARDGHWQLNWQDRQPASGKIADFNPDVWHHLRLTIQDTRISGFINGEQLASVDDTSGTKGMAFLAATYDRNLFDNVRVTSPPPAARSEP